MFVKLAVFACTVALGAAVWNGPLAGGSPADKYPAGVSPQACPNYPHCDNPAIAANPSAAAHGAWNGGWNGGAGAWNGGGGAGAWNGGAGAGAWNGGHAGGWNGGAAAGAWNGGGGWDQNALDNGQYIGDGDYRGEGLQESGAYGDVSQNWNNNNVAAAPAWGHAGAPVHGAAQVPAGVDPSACPNYPFCH